MRNAIGIFVLCLSLKAAVINAQELFVFTEPASNMPAKSMGIRVTNTLMKETGKSGYNYHSIPEIMWGVNKNLMLHAEGFVSNRNTSLVGEGVAAYAKYRFYSKDDMYRHFRMAAFARVSANNADIHQEEIETNGHNTGYEIGWIGTQLLHKLALSTSVSYEKALDNGRGNKYPANQSSNAVNYTFSAGRLMLPKEYTGYKQLNVNLMVEMLGQTLAGNGKSYMDIAPSVQFIINSQARIDLAYRQQLYSSMSRTAPNGFLLRIEYLLFNVL